MEVESGSRMLFPRLIGIEEVVPESERAAVDVLALERAVDALFRSERSGATDQAGCGGGEEELPSGEHGPLYCVAEPGP